MATESGNRNSPAGPAIQAGPGRPVVWLAYVSYPITTAVYLERALRRDCSVVTCGPKITDGTEESRHLQSFGLPVLDHDLPLEWRPDMASVVEAARGRVESPDLYIWIESAPGYVPRNLGALRCPKVCYLIDSHLNLREHLQWATHFDKVFIAQREYQEAFRSAGIRDVQWLPLACDPEVNAKRSDRKLRDVGFVGSILPNSRRLELLQRVAEAGLLVEPKFVAPRDMALHVSESRIGFNNAIRNDLNMRVFETLSTGTFLLTDVASNSGQEQLFRCGEDLGTYEDAQLIDRVRHWLIHEEEREAIAARGRRMVHAAHTYRHRCQDLLSVCLGGKTSTHSAGELRELSLAGLPRTGAWIPPSPTGPTGRSFIIPVLHADLDQPEGFHALLRDLEGVEGEVIALFNSPEAAEAYRHHPRINLSATLNVNVGVARARNIGTHLSTQPTLFFFDADLRIQPDTIDVLENALWTLPDAGSVGPQGSCFQFSTYRDLQCFDKGQARRPTAVDAVSGFLFAVKRQLFTDKLLQFENAYTPCFSEDWDLALQIKMAGLRSYVVPVTGYSHEWGISRDPRRVVRYYGTEQAEAREILARNRIHFWRKWLAIAGKQDPDAAPQQVA